VLVGSGIGNINGSTGIDPRKRIARS